jgi:hypothetical protein
MSLEQLDRYIRGLRLELEWRKSGPVHKVRTKQLQVAVKVRDLQYPDASDRRSGGSSDRDVT